MFFVAPTKGDAVCAEELLASYDLDVPMVEEPVPALLARGEFRRAIVSGHLNQGFRLPEAHLVVVTFDEIFGTRTTTEREHEEPSEPLLDQFE